MKKNCCHTSTGCKNRRLNSRGISLRRQPRFTLRRICRRRSTSSCNAIASVDSNGTDTTESNYQHLPCRTVLAASPFDRPTSSVERSRWDHDYGRSADTRLSQLLCGPHVPKLSAEVSVSIHRRIAGRLCFIELGFRQCDSRCGGVLLQSTVPSKTTSEANASSLDRIWINSKAFY